MIIMKLWDKVGQFIINLLIVIIVIIALFTVYSFTALKVMNKDYVTIFGYTYFEVASGSMEPAISKNDMIIVKLTKDYQEEDIVTYYLNGDFITHRVKRIDVNTITTKGDANNTKDTAISKDAVLGKVVLVLPKAGIWKQVFLTPKVLILLIITFTLFSFTFSYNTKKKRKKLKMQIAKRNKAKAASYDDAPVVSTYKDKIDTSNKNKKSKTKKEE